MRNPFSTSNLASLFILACSALALGGCSDAQPHGEQGPDPFVGPETYSGNAYSWDGSWSPGSSDFPLSGLFDDLYWDGHALPGGELSPILPPGEWDWKEGSLLSNWRNFEKNVGRFEPLKDDAGRQYGWTLVGNEPGSLDYAGPAAYFHGSSGTDILNLGSEGSIHSFGSNMGDGPDVLVFDRSWTLDFRTGSSVTGASRDNDIVIAGCHGNADDSWDITTTTIHTGPGRDLVFVRDLDRAAIDAGNGEDGRTDAIDPSDGDDVIVIHGNMHDSRFYGGHGKDTMVWYVEEVHQSTQWLGPSFFGAGGMGDALWGDDGPNRLVLAIAEDTPVVTARSSMGKGKLLLKEVVPGEDDVFKEDAPTAGDPYAYYCSPCGVGPEGQKTIVLQYMSADGKIDTGYVGLTAIQEVQVGLGPGARVYRIDETTGKSAVDPGLEIFEVPAVDLSKYCDAR